LDVVVTSIIDDHSGSGKFFAFYPIKFKGFE
jgi:hypothetical protein